MQLAKFLLIATIALAPHLGHAQTSGASSLVERGLAAYVKDGGTAAIQSWLKGSALEGNPQALTQANALRQIEDFYGKPESYQIISDQSISSKVRMVLAVLNYSKGPAFLRMQVYLNSSNEWISTEFKFSTEAVSLLPSSMLYER